MMRKSIGLVGCGHWGKNILRDLLILEVDVFVFVLTEKARDQALQLGAKKAYIGITDIAKKVDGFIVATPTVTHADVLEQLLPFNKPIFVEKPLTSDVQRARQLMQYGKDKIFLMDKWRYHPGVDTIAKKAKTGILGDIQLIRTCRLGWGNPHPDVDALWILLPHDLAIVLHILGNIPPLYSVIPLLPSNPSAGVMITLKDKNSPTVILEMSTVQPSKHRGLYVVGSDASIELSDSYDNKLTLFAGKPAALDRQVHHIAIDNSMPLYLELKAFLNYLNGGTPPLSTLEDGVFIVEIIHQIREELGLREHTLTLADSEITHQVHS